MVIRIVLTMFSTVQDAIDVSSEGDSINILAGKFDGFEVTVDNLKIFGCGIGRTIIDGAPALGSDSGVIVGAERTILQNFTVQGFEAGIFFQLSANQNLLKNIESKYNRTLGFSISGTDHLVLDCVALLNGVGFVFGPLDENTTLFRNRSF
ncbi:hypothetical protein WAK64_13335 [Bacillus spongiae]|uniref:Right handed beta helix domain-containing protein n=1 Tax=Bacillus spongiae TaxID=2683610 RepID=A0ABU8HFV5_9BACI